MTLSPSIPVKRTAALGPIETLLVSLLLGLALCGARAHGEIHFSAPYGANPAAGATFEHAGVSLYYEVYGKGPPLLLIHGNGASIGSMSAQIEYFRRRNTVIAMDSRDHGNSGDSPGALTFEQMADDLAALLDHLHLGPALVLGWSDGAIEALLLGVRHPDKVVKIAAMAANLEPGENALYPEVIAYGSALLARDLPVNERTGPKADRAHKVTQLDLDEPHINPAALEAVSAPTLVLAADHDMIRDEHTLVIYHHLKNSQLAIFPNATHMIPFDDPALFNATVARFFDTPFVKKDRIRDFDASYREMVHSEAKR